MKRRLIVMGIALVVVFGGLVGWNLVRDHLREEYLAKNQPGPTAVSVSTVGTTSSQPTLSAVGTLNAAEQVQVTTQSGGKVTKILFKDGQKVKEGQLLVVLDDAVQRAQLEGALAQQEEAADAVKRFKPLLDEGAISQYKYDQIQAKYKEATAQVGQARAALSFVRVTAPFAGRLGIRQVSLGQLVQPGTNIVTLDTEGGLYCDFAIPETHRDKVSIGQKVTVTTDAAPGKTFTATVTAINPQINTSTRNFSVRAKFPDDDPDITPGSFADVRIDVDAPSNVIMIPRTAIAYTLYGDTVFVLDESTKKELAGKDAFQIKKTPVTPGKQRGQDVIISAGLKTGQRIVTSGQLRLEDGDWVTPQASELEAPKQLPEE